MQLNNFHTCNFCKSWLFAKNGRLNTREHFWIYGKYISIMTIDGLANCHLTLHVFVYYIHTYHACVLYTCTPVVK